jgi:FkbM family methyltransferase
MEFTGMKINFSFQRLATSLMWRFFACSGMRFTLRSGLEVAVADRHEMATFREIFVQQEYDDFLDRLPPAATVLDLGCNSGYFAVMMLNRARIQSPGSALPKLVLVDANEQAVQRSQAMLTGCGVSAPASFITGLIGARQAGRASFFLATASAESSSVNRTKRAREVQVPCVDLEALMKTHFPNGLDLIKCDIEGGEEALVDEWGDVLPQAQALLIEWHGFTSTWESFVERLSKLGFTCLMERPAGRYKNALFVRAGSPAATASTSHCQP